MLLCAGIAGTFIYLREILQRQLRPLRRTDNLTTAATQEHLEDDLAKEIQRSEREGSELSVIALALDREHTERLDARDLDDATIEIGRLLHNNLRLFDSYYLWKTQEFLIVLPHTSSAQAVKIANTIRVRIRRELKIKGESISVSMGVSGLNVGDEPRSLTERAERALEATRHKASNRTHLYRETEPTTEDDVDPVDGSVGDDE
jgi:diguanylate cyclase (GGDEF)-like protein